MKAFNSPVFVVRGRVVPSFQKACGRICNLLDLGIELQICILFATTDSKYQEQDEVDAEIVRRRPYPTEKYMDL